jgi:hypothetical protein
VSRRWPGGELNGMKREKGFESMRELSEKAKGGPSKGKGKLHVIHMLGCLRSSAGDFPSRILFHISC